jgi:cell wall-associated NlpC family hydrolase
MDYAGASRILRALRRLLAGAAPVALLALALGTAAAHAQAPTAPAPAPAPVTPGQALPDQTPDDDAPSDGEDWDDAGTGDYDEGTSERWDDNRHAPPLVLPPGANTRPGFVDPVEEELPAVTTTYVAGKVARMRTDGKAAIPRGAPKRVRSLIAQYNRIVGKRYKWGGGHATLVDSGYDCSGAVGYGLINTGMLATTMVSGSFARWGAAGAGRWVTVYAHRSHVYVEVAGLRLDTSPVGDRGGRSGVRWRPVIGQRRGFKARHPVGL